ncbi:MAG TPA: DUF3142 domain-containing protein [Chthoniobacteraceae bacterium]|nr:DUF3142 domain-containing protein [Chthoniobacteraceae bacterium]
MITNRNLRVRTPRALGWAALLCVLFAELSAGAGDVSFWVWKRELVLSARQQELLRQAGTRALLWHVGSLRAEGGRWVPETTLGLPVERMKGVDYIPVFRLTPAKDNPLSAEAAVDLAARIRALPPGGFAEAQLDFDCPDRLLPQYAEFLRACRTAVAPLRLSATALAGWSEAPAFTRLQAGVDALYPMFYDLQPDAPAEVRAGRVLPPLDGAIVARQLKSWSACRIPWQAGLPGFARVTVFDAQGKSRGHVRQWSWDAVAFNPALQTLAQPAPGVTLLRAQRDCVLGQTPVAAGETVACRLPTEAVLRDAIGQARAARAAGIAVFRLPEGGASGGWSLAEWTSLFNAQKPAGPAFRLARSGEAIELTNTSAIDLPPRLAGPGGAQDRGWQLEVEAGGLAAFREASAGDFAAVHGHRQPEAPAPIRVAIPLAERLTFWLADLPAGAARRSGLLLVAPGAGPLRWRIPGSPQNAAWQLLE